MGGPRSGMWKGQAQKFNNERCNRFLEAYSKGDTLDTIGRRENLTRERVRQVMAIYGADRVAEAYRLHRLTKVEVVFCEICKRADTLLKSAAKRLVIRLCSKECRLAHNKRERDLRNSLIKDRTCKICKVNKPITEYYWYRFPNGDLRMPHSRCKMCHAVMTTSWKDRNPEKARAIQEKANQRQKDKHAKETNTERSQGLPSLVR